MTLPVININTEKEPHSFHNTGEEHRFYSLGLGFDVFGDTDNDAKEKFNTFVENASHLKFYLYILTKEQNQLILKRVDDKPLEEIVGTRDQTLVDRLKAWPKKRKVPFSTPLPSMQSGDETDAHCLRATHLLGSAAAFDAPLPHRIGLMRLVKVPESPNDFLYLLPVSKDTIEVINQDQWDTGSGETSPEVIQVVVDMMEFEDNPVLIHTNQLDQEFYLADLNPMILDNGFVQVRENESASGFYRFSKLFEERSATLMWTLPRLIEGPSKSWSEKEPNPIVEYLKDPNRLSWFVKVSVVAALDPVLMSLMMPGMPNESEGHIISVLISSWFGAIEKINQTNEGDPPLDFATVEQLRNLSTTLRDEFKKQIEALEVVNPDNESKAIEKLIYILGLKDDGSAEMMLLSDWLTKDPPGQEIPGETVAVILAALRRLFFLLQDEFGAETIVSRIINQDFQTKVSNRLFQENEDKSFDDEILKEIIALTWKSFFTYLTGDFNGAEAVRRTCGSIFHNLLVKSGEDELTTLAKYKDLLENSDFFRRRIQHRPNGETDEGLFSPVINALWIPAGRPEPDDADELDGWLKEQIQKVLMSDLGLDSTVQKRFQPDAVPEPLPLQIAATMSSDKLDHFTRVANGFGVLVGVKEEGIVLWSHACLAQLIGSPFDPNDSEVTLEPVAIHPLQPAALDGQQKIFIEYNGFPFASAAFQNEDETTLKDSPIPFYTLEDIEIEPDDETIISSRLPGLAYGKEFYTATFVITKGGTLPRVLAGDKPWKTNTLSDDLSLPDGDGVYQSFYMRHTAIGRVSILNKDDDRRIGKDLTDIEPLSLDYPRTGFMAGKTQTAILDILRNRNGSGGIDLDGLSEQTGDAGIEIRLKSLRFKGCASKLIVSLMFKTDAGWDETSTDEAIDISGEHLTDLLIIIKIAATGDIAKPVFNYTKDPWTATFSLPDAEVKKDYWIRLKFDGKKNSTTSPGTNENDIRALTFDTVEGDKFKAYYSSPEAPPVLMMAPKNNQWKPQFKKEFWGKIELSRVTFLDVEHWMNNAELLDEMGSDNIKSFLLFAYQLRQYDSYIAQLIDRLPDPAVSGYRIELVALDALGDPFASTQKDFLWGDKGAYSTLKDLPGDIGNWELGTGREFLKTLREFLKTLDEKNRFSLNVKTQKDDIFLSVPECDSENKSVEIALPEGTVALLNIRPLVKANLWDKSVIHPGMLQMALGKCKGPDKVEYYLFGGASLRIEVMDDVFKEYGEQASSISQKFIKIEPFSSARAYSINLPPVEESAEEYKFLRQTSMIDVHTQRWRFTGRPIYNWINPKDHISTDDPKNGVSVVVLDNNKFKAKLNQFETELFFDRDHWDSETMPVRYHLSAKSDSELQTLRWDPPSATYYRHRFTYRSRYRGAMLSTTASVNDWDSQNSINPPGSNFSKWSRRVAVLAEPDGLVLTRPQVRVYVPLSEPPAGDHTFSANKEKPKFGSPPLACILEEPPFSVGGLAERISAIIASAPGYGFESENDHESEEKSPIVTPIDIGREVGPDPRISVYGYKPVGNAIQMDPSLGYTASLEGPIGLHYERDFTPAPAWRNSQFLVKPIEISSPNASLPDETFMALQMQRYLDPNWVVRKGEQNAYANKNEYVCDASQPWIAQYNSYGHIKLGFKENQTEPVAVVCIEKDNGSWEVTIDRRFLDVTAQSKHLSVCRFPVISDDQSLYLQHTPSSDNQFILSIFADSEGSSPETYFEKRIKRGEANLPIHIASIIWSRDGDALMKNEAVDIIFENAEKPVPLHASATTALEWTRTARNAEYVDVIKPICGPKESTPMRSESTQCRTKELSISIKSNDAKAYVVERKMPRKIVWAGSKLLKEVVPLHIQRHLALVFTSQSAGQGNKIDVYSCAYRLEGKCIDLSGIDTKRQKLHAARFLEYEVPARILGAGSESIPEPYKNPLFDVISTNGTDASDFFFHIRFTNNPKSMTSELSGTLLIKILDLNQDSGNQIPSIEIPMYDFLNAKFCKGIGTGAITPVRAIDVRLVRKSENGKISIQCRKHFWDGSMDDIKELGNKDIPNKIAGFTLSIKGIDKGELWATVSLLHSTTTKGNRSNTVFNFDWLFSKTENDDLKLQVHANKLKSMSEVQARMVAVSAPVPVFN